MTEQEKSNIRKYALTVLLVTIASSLLFTDAEAGATPIPFQCESGSVTLAIPGNSQVIINFPQAFPSVPTVTPPWFISAPSEALVNTHVPLLAIENTTLSGATMTLTTTQQVLFPSGNVFGFIDPLNYLDARLQVNILTRAGVTNGKLWLQGQDEGTGLWDDLGGTGTQKPNILINSVGFKFSSTQVLINQTLLQDSITNGLKLRVVGLTTSGTEPFSTNYIVAEFLQSVGPAIIVTNTVTTTQMTITVIGGTGSYLVGWEAYSNSSGPNLC